MAVVRWMMLELNGIRFVDLSNSFMPGGPCQLRRAGPVGRGGEDVSLGYGM